MTNVSSQIIKLSDLSLKAHKHFVEEYGVGKSKVPRLLLGVDEEEWECYPRGLGMNNLIYGIKKKNQRLYLEDIEELKTKPEVSFVFDREYARKYFDIGRANTVRNILLKHNIPTEVIVLGERE